VNIPDASFKRLSLNVLLLLLVKLGVIALISSDVPEILAVNVVSLASLDWASIC
jgi:hypothetical protein